MSIVPENYILQFSDADYNINHQGVQSSNINGTEIQQTFPTTSTGTSTGNYNHLGIDGQNNNKWDFLNISGTLDGGYNFWHSSDAHAPLLITSIDDAGILVDRSTSTSSLVDLPNITASGNNFAITASPINVPPWNISGYGNPVQVLHNTAHLTTGTTYYASGLSPQTLQICTNADGSGVIDTSDLVSQPQPILASVGGSPILTPKTIAMTGTELTITDDTQVSILNSQGLYFKTSPTFAPAVLSKSGLSISDGAGNTNSLLDNQSLITNGTNNNTSTPLSIRLDNGYLLTNVIEKDKITISDNINNIASILQNNGFSVRDYGSSQNTNINNSRFLINNDITGQSATLSNQYMSFQNSGISKIVLNPLDTATITIADGTNSSVLSPTDLQFNSVSLVGAVSTNTTNIATNTTNIATNTSNITTLQQNAIQTPIIQLCSPAVYGTSPSLPPQKMFVSSSASNIINIGYGGWYWRNFITGTNIGWNAGFASSTSTVGDLMQLSFSFLTPNTTTSPQCTVYSLPATGGNFFNSRRSYVNTGTPVANTPYLYYINFNGYTGVPFKSGHTSVLMTNTNVSNVGAFAPTETLYFWSVGTNSATTANSVELIVSSMTFKMTNNGSVITQPYSFLNNEVINAQPVLTASGTVAITPYHYGASFGATNDITVANTYMRAQDALFYITFTNAKTTGAVGITYTAPAGNQTYILSSSGTQVSLSWSGTSWSVI